MINDEEIKTKVSPFAVRSGEIIECSNGRMFEWADVRMGGCPNGRMS